MCVMEGSGFCGVKKRDWGGRGEGKRQNLGGWGQKGTEGGAGKFWEGGDEGTVSIGGKDFSFFFKKGVCGA